MQYLDPKILVDGGTHWGGGGGGGGGVAIGIEMGGLPIFGQRMLAMWVWLWSGGKQAPSHYP